MSEQQTTDLVRFTYGEAAVRVVMIDGEPWFMLGDLCRALGIANVGNVASRLDEAGIRQADIRSGGQIIVRSSPQQWPKHFKPTTWPVHSKPRSKAA